MSCDYVSARLKFDILSVSEVESSEQGVVLWGWFASLILIQEDRWASHFHAQLLDSLLIVDGQQEGLEARFGAHCGQNGEVLRKNTTCTGKRGKRNGNVSQETIRCDSNFKTSVSFLINNDNKGVFTSMWHWSTWKVTLFQSFDDVFILTLAGLQSIIIT